MKIKILNNAGITIIEVAIAIAIITVGMVGVSSLVVQNIRAQYINKNILVASGLAQEGLELVRNIRDLNWLTAGNAWNQDIVGDGTYTIDYRGRANVNPAINFLDEEGARLYVKNGGWQAGLYVHDDSAPNIATNFYRLITVADNGDFLDVKCSIRWSDAGQNHVYTAETYLYNWR